MLKEDFAAAARSAIGYATESGGVMGRVDVNSNRSSGFGWEIRLGKLQVAVWLGLAVGACVGGYFVGFFSGRYVGFESARESSSSEIAKLPAPDVFADASMVNPNGVYDRLKAPAVLPDSGGPRASAKMAEAGSGNDMNRRAQGADISDRKKLDGNGGSQSGNEPARSLDGVKLPTDTQSDTLDDELFGALAPGEELIIGDETFGGIDKGAGVPPSVRMLGARQGSLEPAVRKVDQALDNSPKNESSSSAAAILDARIANARSEAEKAAQKNQTAQQQAIPQKNASGSRVGPPVESSNLVRKVLPAGYFAQVAAPKKLAEAEGVAKRLKKSGFPVVVESATVNGQSFYRVLVGPEENKVQAERLVSQLQSESFVASKPFIRKVN